MNSITEDTQTYADSVTNEVIPTNDVESKVLGVLWDKGTDEFVFRFDDICLTPKCFGKNIRNI